MPTQRFSTYLILGVVILIIASTLSAGAPAYWLTRTQLEAQTWSNLQDAARSVHSLLNAEQERLRNLARLFSERPTLHQLIAKDARAELSDYLADFQRQSELGLLLFCANNGSIISGDAAQIGQCPSDPLPEFGDWNGKPMLLVRQPVHDERSSAELGVAIAGIALEDAFWQQMSANTGAQLSLLDLSQIRIASSIPAAAQLSAAAPVTLPVSSENGARYRLDLAGQPFYALTSGLSTSESFSTTIPFQLEVALPVDQLVATEQRAFVILLISTGLIAVLGVLLATWYMRRLTQPLWQLTRAAERIGKGDIDTAIPAFVAPLEVATLSNALIKSQATMLRALEERSDFLDSVSHEFQTPLSTLQAALELVGDEEENLNAAEMRELLKPAHMSLVGLKNLIDNLLQSSSIEAGLFTMRKRPTTLTEIIDDACRLVQPLLDRRHQPLQLPETDHLPTLNADPARLTQVLVNLLVNASKYSPVGEQIDLAVDLQQNRLRIAVADRGPGIPPAERPHLFQRFVRLAQRDNEQSGVGLGLHVVKTTVESHGGEVGIEGRAGGGSLFWFTLPLEEKGMTR
ncbi:MAG: HAMP domain-containing sensor histidine kinase [Caldilineaceae bacterium]